MIFSEIQSLTDEIERMIEQERQLQSKIDQYNKQFDLLMTTLDTLDSLGLSSADNSTDQTQPMAIDDQTINQSESDPIEMN